MKKMTLAALVLAVLCLLSACMGNRKDDLVGIWECELYGSVQQIEFTENGYFIDHTGYAKNRYTADGDEITVFVEDVPDSDIDFDYRIHDDILTFGGAEYTRITKDDLFTEYME